MIGVFCRFNVFESSCSFPPSPLVVEELVDRSLVLIVRGDSTMGVLLAEVPLKDFRAHVLNAHYFVLVRHHIILLDAVVLGELLFPCAYGLHDAFQVGLLRVIERSSLIPHGPIPRTPALVSQATPGFEGPRHSIGQDHGQWLTSCVSLEVLIQLLLEGEVHFIVGDVHLELDEDVVLLVQRRLGLGLNFVEQRCPAPVTTSKKAFEFL